MSSLRFPRFSWSLAALIAGSLLLPASASFGQVLVQWNTFGNLGTETAEPSIFNETNLTGPINLTLGAGLVGAGNANRFGGSNWFDTGNSASSTLAEAVAGNNFIQFIVTPNSGFAFTATSFVFSWDHSSTGPAQVTLRSSADGFTANLGQATGLAASITSGNTFPISGLSNISIATTFRIYGSNATATGGTGGFDVAASGVNVQLNGSTAAVPEPATVLAGLGAVVALGFHVRRRRGANALPVVAAK